MMKMYVMLCVGLFTLSAISNAVKKETTVTHRLDAVISTLLASMGVAILFRYW